MKNELQKLKEKLDNLLVDKSPGSQEVLILSEEIDLLINEYYQKQNFRMQILNIVRFA